MIKKIILAAILALPAIASAQTVKIGLVDTQALMTSMPEMKAASEKMEATQKSYQEEYQKLGEEMNRKLEEFRAMKEDEPAAIKERKTRELEDFNQKIQQFQQQAEQDLNKLQQDLLMPIQQKIRDAIQSVGKEGNYTLIQEIQQQLYHAAPAVDITADVKAKLGIK